jgi:hypothetical protein
MNLNTYIYSHRTRAGIFYLSLAILIFLNSACSNPKPPVPRAVQDYLANQGVQETLLDLDYTNPSIPDKRYISVSVTYNFSTSDGKPQKEYLAFILKQEGDSWKIDKNAAYTKSDSKAKEILSSQEKK